MNLKKKLLISNMEKFNISRNQITKLETLIIQSPNPNILFISFYYHEYRYKSYFIYIYIYFIN